MACRGPCRGRWCVFLGARTASPGSPCELRWNGRPAFGVNSEWDLYDLAGVEGGRRRDARAGLIEKISNSVVPIRAPSTMMRPVSNAEYGWVSYVPCTFSLATLAMLIWLRSENRSDVSVLL